MATAIQNKEELSIAHEQAQLKNDINICRDSATTVIDELCKVVTRRQNLNKNTTTNKPELSVGSGAKTATSTATDAIMPVGQAEMTNLEEKSLLESLQEIQSSLSPENEDLQGICLLAYKLLNNIKSLEDRWSDLDCRLTRLSSSCNVAEQYSKNFNLIVDGLKIPYKLKGTAFTQNIVNQINSCLPNHNLFISCHQIDTSQSQSK